MRMMNTLWLLGAAALAVGLSGCGGGSNTRPDTTAATTPPAAKKMEMEEMETPLDSGEMGARGVTVGISQASDATTAAFTFMKGEESWTDASTTTAATVTGWDGSAVQNADSNPTERIVAYTNIEAATATPFHEVEGEAPITVMASNAVVPDPGTTNLPSAPNLSLTFMDDPDTEDDNEAMFEGTLDGTEGTFTCTVAPCTLSRVANDGEGNPVWALVGGWGFTADDGQMLDVPDPDYLAFGYWNKVAIESLADDVTPFYYGSTPYAGNVQALSGSATYTGAAAGGYEHRTYDQNTGKPSSTYGHFTAAVSLNAFFGGEDGMSTIDGMVDTFVLVAQEGDNPLVGDWGVMLKRTEVTGQSFMGGTNGGHWNGAFFGPSDEGQLPSGVAGGFDAEFDNGAVKGAYGATR